MEFVDERTRKQAGKKRGLGYVMIALYAITNPFGTHSRIKSMLEIYAIQSNIPLRHGFSNQVMHRRRQGYIIYVTTLFR